MNEKYDFSRYSRQMILPEIGRDGQKKLMDSSVVIIGCGALGNVVANNLTRAGIGKLVVVDRDIVDTVNLHRQSLFTESDIGVPKAYAIAKKLKEINSDICIEYITDDVHSDNIEKIVSDVDVVIDGTDNMDTRFVINDVCVKNDIPWVYGGAVGTYGMCMAIIPNNTPCFRCVFPHLPPAGSLPTCENAGILNTIPVVIGAMETTESIKILIRKEDIAHHLIVYDIWRQEYQVIKISRNNNCICCVRHDFEFLRGKSKSRFVLLCGENAIQITPPKTVLLSFDKLAKKLSKLGTVHRSEIVLRFDIETYQMHIFRNGRTIIYGTRNENIAKSLYAKYLGM